MIDICLHKKLCKQVYAFKLLPKDLLLVLKNTKYKTKRRVISVIGFYFVLVDTLFKLKSIVNVSRPLLLHVDIWGNILIQNKNKNFCQSKSETTKNVIR